MDERYLEAVLDVVARVPAGRATTYGTIADVLGEQGHQSGPRQVGTILSRAGSGVPWWRVVNASGLPPAHLRAEAITRLRAEGCPTTPPAGPVDEARVDLRRAIWWPEDLSPGPAGS